MCFYMSEYLHPRLTMRGERLKARPIILHTNFVLRASHWFQPETITAGRLCHCTAVNRYAGKTLFQNKRFNLSFFFTFLVVAMRPLVLHRRITRPLMRSRVCTCLLLIDDVFVEFSCSHERMISYILIYHLGVKWINTVL